MASRTLLVNPKDEQKQAYLIANDALETMCKSLKTGRPISEAYMAAKTLLDSRKEGLVYQTSFGFGIGSQFKEEKLLISAKNATLVEPGMVFHARITLNGVHKDNARSVIAIGDTLYIDKEGSAVVLTAGIQKRYNDISYSLDDEEAQPAKKSEPAKPKPKEVKKPEKVEKPKKKKEESEDYSDEEDEDYDGESGSEGSQEVMKQGTYTSSRLRSKAVNQKEKQDEMEVRKTHQLELLEHKKEELKTRFNKGEIKCANAKTKVKSMDTFTAFKSPKDFPKDIVPG
jgi:nucleosome binding factor SPN SPT16 subunit